MCKSIIRLVSVPITLPLCLYYHSAWAFPQVAYNSDKPVEYVKKNVHVRYQNGFLSIQAHKVHLSSILGEVARKTGLHVSFIDPDLGSGVVSISLHNTSLKSAVQSLMKGLSYAYIHHHDQGFKVIVLATGASLVSESIETELDASMSPLSHHVSPASLEAYEPLLTDSETGDSSGTRADPIFSDSEDPDQRRKEQMVDRSLSVLRSEHQHLYRAGMEQLVGLDHPEATRTLVDATQTDSGWLTREQAVDLLWQHVRNRQYADSGSIDALRGLALDEDEHISQIAQQAILEIDQAMANED